MVTFTSSSSDTDGSIVSNAWDLDNDGAFDDGSQTSITKQFSSHGPQIVRLQVTDKDGASDVAAKTISVANRAPTASIDMLPASPASLEPVTFSAVATDVDGTIATMLWDTDNDGSFDDGFGPAVIRSFPSKGTYIVKVRVADNQGLTAIGTRVVTVAK